MSMDLVKRNKFIKHVSIVFLFCSLKASYSQFAKHDSLVGRIEIQCTIPDLNVYLDDQSIGKTPLFNYTVVPGKHTIRIQNPDPLDWLSRDWESTFSIRKNENRIFNVRFDRVYWIGSSPSGANIFSEDRLLGKTPASVTFPDGSSEEITLKYPGYLSKNINATRQHSQILHILLEKLPVNEAIQSPHRPSLGSKKIWLIGGGIVALASGIAGYYYKDRAEKAYRDYLSSENPEEMNRYFNDSKRYDTSSGILYGIGEISLGITLCLSLWGSPKN
jgi:hypothetical protein